VADAFQHLKAVETGNITSRMTTSWLPVIALSTPADPCALRPPRNRAARVFANERAEFAVVVNDKHACGTFGHDEGRITQAGLFRRNFYTSLTILPAFTHMRLTVVVSITTRKELQL